MKFNSRIVKSDLLLLLTAAIWGFAFVAQRAGMEHVGPFIFNALRFGLGSLCLVPVLILSNRRHPGIDSARPQVDGFPLLPYGLLTGVVLFFGASFQQVGVVYTTAGKAGFITGLYVIIVPILGLIWGQRIGRWTWYGAILATMGLYLLSVVGPLNVYLGDMLVLVSAFIWAAHVHLIGWLSPRVDSIKLALMQFLVCSILSLVVSLIFETTTLQGMYAGAIPILYGGIFSVGTAFTLQVVAQRDAKPSHAAIIMSLEAVFAVIGGWMLLGESLSVPGKLGCVLMFAGMLCSRAEVYREVKKQGN